MLQQVTDEFPKFINRHLQAGADPGLDFGGGLNCLFHVNSFFTLLFAIGNIAVWGACPWIRSCFQFILFELHIFQYGVARGVVEGG